MNRIKIGIAVLILFAAWLMQSCDQDFCYGYQGEPRFSVGSDSVDFKIYATNGEVGDTLYSENFVVHVPVDMNADRMRYEIYAPDYKGDILFDYALESKECPEDDRIYLLFTAASFSDESTFKEFYSREEVVTHGRQLYDLLNVEGYSYYRYEALFLLKL